MKFNFFLIIISGLILILSCCKKDDSTINTVTDVDGNVYKTLTLGTQTWMLENLKTTKYNDGTPIPNVTESLEWGNLNTGAYCNYNNLVSNATTYGRLYNWYAVNTEKLAPKGWHVPNDGEWDALVEYLTNLGYDYNGAGIGKSMASVTGWDQAMFVSTGDEPSTNNKSGFTALPAGYRYHEGSFNSLGQFAYWWSSTKRFSSFANSNRSLAGIGHYFFQYHYLYLEENHGFSVRCIKDK